MAQTMELRLRQHLPLLLLLRWSVQNAAVGNSRPHCRRRQCRLLLRGTAHRRRRLSQRDPRLPLPLQRLAVAVRRAPQVEIGPSPRAALALLEVGRSAALLADRDFLIPDDLKRFVVSVWAHRVRLTAEAEIEGLTPATALERVAQTVEVPH